MRKRWICAAAALAWARRTWRRAPATPPRRRATGEWTLPSPGDRNSRRGHGTSDAPGEAAPPAEAGANDAGTDGAPTMRIGCSCGRGPVGPFLTLSYTFNSFGESAYEVFDPTTGAEQGSLTYAQFGRICRRTRARGCSSSTTICAPDGPGPAVEGSLLVERRRTAAARCRRFVLRRRLLRGRGGHQAYVALFTRNYIAVLDTSTVADGGAPLKSIS